MAKKIKLTQGKVAIVDDADYESIASHKWTYAADGTKGGRAVRFQYLGIENDDYKEKTIAMHQQILGISDRTIKHKNQNGLDNRRSNLVILPPRSRFRGVYAHPAGKWVTSTMHHGSRIRFGNYDSEEAAHIAVETGKALLAAGLTDAKEIRRLCYIAAARPQGLEPLTIKQLLKRRTL